MKEQQLSKIQKEDNDIEKLQSALKEKEGMNYERQLFLLLKLLKLYHS